MGDLDTLDVRILREFVHDRQAHPLQSEVRKSFRTVAERLKVDEGTVRNRIRKLLKTGFIEEWNIIENPNLVGALFVSLRLDVANETEKDATIEKLKLIPGVLLVTDYYGSALRLLLFHEDERDLKDRLSLIKRICGSTSVSLSSVAFPECTLSLSRKDWELIGSIRTDPWKQFITISKETSLSTKTVKRRLGRLIRGSALFLTMSIDPKMLRGLILAELYVAYESAGAKGMINKAVASHIEDSLLSAQMGDPEHALFTILLDNISSASELVRWIRHQDGVREVHLDLVLERIEQYDVLSRRLENKMKNTTPAGSLRSRGGHPGATIQSTQAHGLNSYRFHSQISPMNLSGSERRL